MSGIIGSSGSKSGVITDHEALDYEEGTWTPLLISGFVGPTPQYVSVTSGSKNGNYVKIGGLCYFSIYISNATFSASGGFNNSDNILTLPYTATGLRSRTSTMFQYSGGNFTTNVGGDINPGGNHCYLYKEQIPYAHAAWYQTTNAGTYWIISGSYQVGKTAGPL